MEKSRRVGIGKALPMKKLGSTVKGTNIFTQICTLLSKHERCNMNAERGVHEMC